MKTYQIFKTNEGFTKRINKLFSQWMNAKTMKQHEKWQEKAVKTLFETYDAMTILEALDTQYAVSSEWHYEEFKSAVKRAIRKFS